MQLQAFLAAGFSIFITMNFVFILAARNKRNDYADVVWGPGFVIAALGAIVSVASVERVLNDVRFMLAFTLVAIWAIRLFWYIGLRNLSHSNEDSRYAKWRAEWGRTILWRSYLQVFMLQGFLLLVINSSLIWIIGSEPRAIDHFTYAGVTLWLFGFLFESVGDHQLKQFKKNPANNGELMTSGLWSWTRHPNYFGEVVQWWGIFLLALPLDHGWWTVISPITITFFILKVSGVPMLEAQMQSRRGFKDYAARTSEFFPRPPKN